MQTLLGHWSAYHALQCASTALHCTLVHCTAVYHSAMQDKAIHYILMNCKTAVSVPGSALTVQCSQDRHWVPGQRIADRTWKSGPAANL